MANDKIIACICEGNAESSILNMLIDADKLIFTRNDLLDGEVLRCRNARTFEDKHLGKGFSKKIVVYRILDSRREEFRLRKVYKSKVDVINVITAPEIEMLIIIKERMYSEYCKVKSNTKPSDFCKDRLKIPSVKTKEFIERYFADINDLLFTIKEYKRLSNIPKNEVCLADLLAE